MNGKENIINKILSDADAKCAEIIAVAQAQAQEVTDLAKAHAQKEAEAMDKRLENLSAERQRNNLASAQLEARKYKLLKKQQLISQCYDQALQQLAKLSTADRKAMLSKILLQFAENGEVVYPCKADKDIVNQKFLDGFGKNLVLGKKLLDGAGGLVLEGEGYQKDLTLARLVAFAREQTEAKVASALFGD